MADTTKKKRKRVARRFRRERHPTVVHEIGPVREGPGWPADPPRDWPNDPEGGAGVREPRRPTPIMPAGTMELLEPTSPDTLDLTCHS